MALHDRSLEKRKIFQTRREEEEVIIGSLCSLSDNQSLSPKDQMEHEKKMRREIANSNERRRMQSINAGFQSLKALLPHHEGEKLSKAAILQQTAEHICNLEQEKSRLLSQIGQLKRLVSNGQFGHDSDGGSSADSPLPKRKKVETAESSDEGIGNMSPYEGDHGSDEEKMKKEVLELRIQLDKERLARINLENIHKTNGPIEADYTDRYYKDIAQQVQLQYDGKQSVDDRLEDEGPIKLITHDSTRLPRIIDSSSSCHDSDIPQDLSTSPQDLSTSPDEKRVQGCPLSTTAASCTTTTPSLAIISQKFQQPILTPPSAAIPTIAVPLPNDRHSDSPTLKAMLTHEGNIEIDIPSSQNLPYSASTSRQNLETIVEAIRHLEGDHLFQDDPKPGSSMPIQTDNLCHTKFNPEEISSQLRQQIIQCSPVNPPSRPGVIVATRS